MKSDANARILGWTIVLALCAGMAVVLLDPAYRPKQILESNRGVFSNIPVESSDDMTGE